MHHVEVFILNYNGAHFLEKCLESLCGIERGLHTIHVSVVDNFSQDQSAQIVSTFEGVLFIRLDSNYGFSKGNNLGVWTRLDQLKREGKRADLVCFLNNDTIVEREWLTAAVERFQMNPEIGVVGSRAIFQDPFIEVEFECEPIFRPRDSGSLDMRDLGVFVRALKQTCNVQLNPKRSKWLDSYPPEPCGGRWLKPKGRILIAVEDPNRETIIDLVFENRNPSSSVVTVKLTLSGKEHTISIPQGESRELKATVPPQQAQLLIQNAGSFVTANWEAGDEGMFSRDKESFLEPREVAAVCGVSMFMRAGLFERLKGFDEAFFAYFEDTDLSLRARLQGYSCWFEPRSRLRHMHCGSGGEFSPYFNFNVTHSHLLFAGRWMSGIPFLKKFFQVCKWAWLELKVFESDCNLETKPNLRTLVRMLKHPFRLLNRRVFHLLNSHKIKALKCDELRLDFSRSGEEIRRQ